MKRLASAFTHTRSIRYIPPPSAAPGIAPEPTLPGLYPGAYEPDVMVPTAQASKLAGALALPVAVGGLLLWGLEGWPWWTAPAAAPAAYAVTYAWATARFIGHSRRRIETWQPDPTPPPEPPTVLEIISPDGKQRRNVHLGIDPRTLARFAHDAPRKGLAVNTWTGAGKPFSRREYEQFIRQLRHAGLVDWRNPRNKNLGMEFTAEGLTIMDKLAAQGAAPKRGAYNILDGGPLLEE